MTEPEALDRIRSATKRRKRAEQTWRNATEDLRKSCLDARAEGVPITQIAREAKLSRQGVYDLLDDPQPS